LTNQFNTEKLNYPNTKFALKEEISISGFSSQSKNDVYFNRQRNIHRLSLVQNFYYAINFNKNEIIVIPLLFISYTKVRFLHIQDFVLTYKKAYILLKTGSNK
jgi:hypothetical protein